MQDAVEEVISYMDEYYLGKDDWDAFVELGVDTMKDEMILKKIPTAVKTAFTRQYVLLLFELNFYGASLTFTQVQQSRPSYSVPQRRYVCSVQEEDCRCRTSGR